MCSCCTHIISLCRCIRLRCFCAVFQLLFVVFQQCLCRVSAVFTSHSRALEFAPCFSDIPAVSQLLWCPVSATGGAGVPVHPAAARPSSGAGGQREGSAAGDGEAASPDRQLRQQLRQRRQRQQLRAGRLVMRTASRQRCDIY